MTALLIGEILLFMVLAPLIICVPRYRRTFVKSFSEECKKRGLP